MAEIAAAFVTVAPSARGFGSKLDSEISGDLDKSGRGMGSKFGSALKIGAVAAFTGASVLAVGLGKAIGGAREAIEVAAISNQIIKQTGGVANVTAKQVADLAEQISLKTGVDDEAIQTGENFLLTFKNVRNEVGKGNDIFNRATQSAVDLSATGFGSIDSSAKMLGKALNDPIAGISALSRAGVTFTQQQKDQIAALVESGNTLKAQKIILAEVESQVGGTAAASATAADKFKVAFGNFGETVGIALIPAVDAILAKATELVLFLTANVGPAFTRMQAFIAPFAASLARLFGGGGGGGPSAFMTSIQGLVTSIQVNFLPVLRSIGHTLATDVFPPMLRFAVYMKAQLVPVFTQVANVVANQVVPIVASLAKFVATTLWPALVRISTQVASNLRPAFEQLVSTFRSQVLPALQAGLAKFREWQPTIQKVIGVLVVIIGVLINVQTTILGKVLPSIIKVAGILVGNFAAAVRTATSVVVSIIAAVLKFGEAMIEGGQRVAQFAAAVKDKISQALSVIRSLPGQAASALGNLGSILFNAGAELIQGLINGILSKLGSLGSAMGAVASKVKGFLPGSPVKEGPLTSWNYGAAGKRLVDLLTDGIKSSTPAAVKMVESLAEKVNAAMQAGVDRLKSTLSTLRSEMESLAGSVSQAFATDLFAAETGLGFMAAGSAGNANLEAMLAAFRKLKGMGASRGFLSDLFASGNSALIADLASGTRADLNRAQMFAATQSRLLGDLSSKVARNEYGPRIDRISGQLEGVRHDIQSLAHELARELDRKAGDGKRKAATR